MTTQQVVPVETRHETLFVHRQRRLVLARQANTVLLVVGLALLAYGLAWNYSTRKYLKGFADAIVPLNGSPEEKSDALLKWLRDEPERKDTTVEGTVDLRDPVNIVQNVRLLKYCGSAANAYINLADVAGLNTRRLLLLNESGGAEHVLAEVQLGERWVVVDPSLGFMFRDHFGRALAKKELRDPKVFKDAIRRMPGYNPAYTFERTAHIHLGNIPLLGPLPRPQLDDFFPGWEETINWGYLPEHPSLWPVIVSLPVILLCIFGHLLLDSGRKRPPSANAPIQFRVNN